MEASDELSTPRARVFAELRRLGLERNALELQENGLTLVEGALDTGMLERLRTAILKQVARRAGLDDPPNINDYNGPAIPDGSWLLFEDSVFEEVLTNEPMIALMQYMLGESMQLSNMWSHTRTMNDNQEGLLLHADSYSGGFPLQPDFANCNFALVDYEQDLGALAYVPGSHLTRRQTLPNEMMGHEDCIPVECPAGTEIIFSGGTWHGAYPRKVPGIRLNLSVAMNRAHLITVESLRQSITQEMLDRNPPRFGSLLGQNIPLGFGAEGQRFLDPAVHQKFVDRLTDPFA